MTRTRRVVDQTLLWVITTAILVFLLAPLIVVIPESFSPSTVMHFPPHGLSLQWYRNLIDNPQWRDSFWLSLRLALSVAAVATALGLAAAVAVHRRVRRGKTAIRMLILSPFVIPIIVSSIALYQVVSDLGLVGTFFGLLLAHTVIALPFPVIVIENALKGVDPALEDAAVSLGASRLQAFYKVTLRLILPAVFVGALFAFMASWDEVVIVLLIGGAFLQTLPLTMYQFLTTEVNPTIGAASAALIVVVLVVFIIAQARPWSKIRWMASR